MLVEKHRGILRKVVSTYCRNADDREDLRQEILANLWRAWPRYDPRRPFATWMYRVALNVAISHVRRVYRQQSTMVALKPEHDAEVPFVDEFELRQEEVRLTDAMERLEPLNRAILLLHLDGYAHREVAEMVGISETNVGTKLSRIRTTLKAEMAC